MIGLLIVTHGRLAETLIECADLIMGKTDNIDCLGLFHGDGTDEFKSEIQKKIIKLDKGNGVLILTDLYGGSPCNLSTYLIKELEQSNPLIECVTGVNIPMLLEAINMQDSRNLAQLAEHLVESSKDAIINIRKFYNLCA